MIKIVTDLYFVSDYFFHYYLQKHTIKFTEKITDSKQ